MDVEEVGKLDKQNKNPDEVKQIRENYDSLFSNEEFWQILKLSIAVNVDSSIKMLDKKNIK